MLSVDSKNDNVDDTAELRLIVARRQVNVAEPRLIATGSLVNLLRKVNMPAAWLKVTRGAWTKTKTLCNNENFCSQRYQCETRSKPVLLFFCQRNLFLCSSV